MTINLSTFLGTTFQGNTGTQGLQGAQGPSGFVGSDGAQGAQGIAGSGSQGSVGSQGAQGTQGFTGSQGAQGIQGGGGQGAQGTQGFTGSQGAQGSVGSQGGQGTQGVQGLSNQGISGSQGAQGTQGTFGPATIPQNVEAAAYTLALDDVGKHISAGVGVTIPLNIFSSGDNVVIYNNTTGNIAITTASGGVTLRYAGTSILGNRVLQQRGLATVLCVASNDFVISGAGLT